MTSWHPLTFFEGTRDPCNILDAGAGFVLCWQGNPEIRVGYDNPQKELIQVISDGMLIAVPEYVQSVFRPVLLYLLIQSGCLRYENPLLVGKDNSISAEAVPESMRSTKFRRSLRNWVYSRTVMWPRMHVLHWYCFRAEMQILLIPPSL